MYYWQAVYLFLIPGIIMRNERKCDPFSGTFPSVKYFGEALNLSPYYLSDLLKKETGRNTQEYIHFYIIERAKTALLNSNDPVSQIAYDLGFEYPQHFSKVFKNKTGMSPKEFRKGVDEV